MRHGRRRTTRPAVFATAFAAVIALAAPARADRDPAAAEALFQEAKAALAQNNLEVACAKFRDSNALDPAPGTLYNLADCEERRGKLGTAWALFIEVEQKLTSNDERREQVEERIRSLEPRLSRLVVNISPGAPEGTKVERDGAPVGVGSLGAPVVVDPGKRSLTASAEGYAPRTFEVELGVGETTTIEVAPGAALPPEPEPPPTTTTPDDDGSLHPIGIPLVGVGAVAMGVSVVLAVVAKGQYDDASASCPNGACDQTGFDERNDARTLGDVGTGLFIGGAVVFAAGAILEIAELTSGGDSSNTGSGSSVDPWSGRVRF